jgi:hypothetical protein
LQSPSAVYLNRALKARARSRPKVPAKVRLRAAQ